MSESKIGPESSIRAGGRFSLRTHIWIVLAAFLIVVGTVASFIAANGIATSAAEHSDTSFDASTAQIASELTLAIQHEQDLVVNAGALFTRNAGTSQTQFRHW